MKVMKTNQEDTAFLTLISALDEDLVLRYGESQKQYQAHNGVQKINTVMVVYDEGIPVGCGGYKFYDTATVEMKRVFVLPTMRRKGVAKMLLKALEEAAKAEGYREAILETGTKQEEAIALYQHYGYKIIPNYGPYEHLPYSVCMKKVL
jgi:GNAT superfamily N-acetyltransferase